MANRDLVCVGGSAGALRATEALLAALGNAPVAVCIVHHIGAKASLLDQVLQRSTTYNVGFATHRERIEIGRVYVAPPDKHLVIDEQRVALVHGPRENSARPAIDPLFRSAAVARGAGSMGVLLSGHLDDGVAGLDAIQICGGATLVQSPDDAVAPGMPMAAITALGGRLTAVASAHDLGFMVADIAHRPAPEDAEIPERLKQEHAMLLKAGSSELSEIGTRTDLICPECGGPLTKLRAGIPMRYRCDVGHAFTCAALAEQQAHEVDHALWVALRAIDQRCKVLESLIADAALNHRPHSATRLGDELDELRTNHDILRRLLFGEHRIKPA